MIASPSPVQEIATVRSSAQVPAAISGESPTRPGCLPSIPPVEVAAATPPRASSATAPTVPCSKRRRRSSVMKYGPGAVSSPWRLGERARGHADQQHVPALVEHGAGGA